MAVSKLSRRVNIPCSQCGKLFSLQCSAFLDKMRIRGKVCCSHSCGQKSRRHPDVVYSCKQCHKECTRSYTKYNKTHPIFCSVKCCGDFRQHPDVEVNCAECFSLFTITYVDYNRRMKDNQPGFCFCNASCSIKHWRKLKAQQSIPGYQSGKLWIDILGDAGLLEDQKAWDNVLKAEGLEVEKGGGMLNLSCELDNHNEDKMDTLIYKRTPQPARY